MHHALHASRGSLDCHIEPTASVQSSAGLQEPGTGVQERCSTATFCTIVTADGPPFATGLPHYGHLLAGTIKDIVTRYASQTGHHVSRRFGWDCHGLPVEQETEKMLSEWGQPQAWTRGRASCMHELHCHACTYLGHDVS